MWVRRVAVMWGSLLLGFAVGKIIADVAPHAEQVGGLGVAGGLGLGIVLAAFVRD